ncbi:hypothetical protein VP01_3474g1 [Puccinia sorghi]|uniref:Uncharacterized protein n=1 Tax=Puccinia sorghi TaxID=27349 RepID=A0A0L6UWT6_9BASI|nr:hypothetical protein VP01_3474g1 [Puccinia sorghi]
MTNWCLLLKLNQLPYFDSVQHVALSMMHNWIEGVLMHHFCERPRPKQARLETQAEDQPDEDNTSSDSDSDDFQLNQGATGRLFSTTNMESFQGALTNVVLPTFIRCIRSQLGKSHFVKLKASQWYLLFVCDSSHNLGDINGPNQKSQGPFKLVVDNGKHNITYFLYAYHQHASNPTATCTEILILI